MSATHNMILAGFGGQGVLFAGKMIAYAGMIDERQVSWLPSYGPEMRGGTANGSVIVSDDPIGSPIVLAPDLLIALNYPSYEKFESKLIAGGKLIADSSLIPVQSERTDIDASYIPATQMANENGLKGLANMIALGKAVKESGFTSFETIQKACAKCVPAKKAQMLELNLKALEMGYNY